MGRLDRRLFVTLIASWAVAIRLCTSQQQQPMVLSTFVHPDTWLEPYDWMYLRVELPSWFSSIKMSFMSNVDIDKDRMKKLPKSRLPIMCFKNGSPPLPDVSDAYLEDLLSHFLYNGTFGVSNNQVNMERCIPFQGNLTVTMTNEQISPGIWYLGYFNGLGPARTQSKMISRGQTYKFRTSIQIEGCATSSLWGPYCNQTINMVTCSQPSIYMHSRSLLDLRDYRRSRSIHLEWNGGHLEKEYHSLSRHVRDVEKQVASNSSVTSIAKDLITCNSSDESSCPNNGELKIYFLDIIAISSQFKISTTETFMHNTTDSDDILIMCYIRHSAMPLTTTYDYAADIRKTPLTVKSPRSGRWYIAVQAVNMTTVGKVMEEKSAEANMCFSFEWEVHECLNGRVGLNCTWETHMLQRVPKTSSGFPFESFYVPTDENGSIKRADFPLEYLLSNSSVDNVTWTYFFMDVPRGAAGAIIHIQLIADNTLDYDVYFKHEGIASDDTWDYYLNSTGNNNGSMFMAFDDSKKDKEFYILYAKEGTWCVGLKHPSDMLYNHQTTMSVSLQGCPRHCSSNGECHYSVDRSGLTFYSYCYCDRDHGGFDCSNQLVSPEGHIWQSVFLIASNAAAILPAFWALRQKAFSEWVLFTSSGISSGLYHACDVGTWCPLSFHVLQFMDFWLSFMAVVSTFVYMSTIGEASKRAIHTSVAIITALLAVSGATRSRNIVLVVAIGTLGLLIGWLLEFSTANRSCPTVFDFLVNMRWQNIKKWSLDVMKTLHKRFYWQFILLGFITLALAATSWKLETNESYWIWHSWWHISIYTSSFFFLCSTSVNRNDEHREAEYELTRQNSSSRVE